MFDVGRVSQKIEGGRDIKEEEWESEEQGVSEGETERNQKYLCGEEDRGA